MISVDGLTVEFGGTTLFSDISFQINEKDRIALMGKNGAGKTTLFSIIAGLSDADEGNITLSEGCKVGFLPDVPSFFELLTASEYIDFLTKDMTRKKGKNLCPKCTKKNKSLMTRNPELIPFWDKNKNVFAFPTRVISGKSVSIRKIPPV